MSLKQQLDELRAGHAGVADLVYADMSAQMVLYATSASPRSQETYDRLLGRAGEMLNASGAAMSLAQAVGAKAQDSFLLDYDGTGLKVYVRAAANAEECLIFGCDAEADVSAIAKAASECLLQFAGADE